MPESNHVKWVRFVGNEACCVQYQTHARLASKHPAVEPDEIEIQRGFGIAAVHAHFSPRLAVRFQDGNI
ncbi:hypothetical protein D3C80_2124050 [compost metagenome]